ncbi:Uncharacterized protein dnl_59010 [Desulfonema limicola]|uniref:Uncharacterized protein n=1 Tax=Desulfonema limicola TaxID=45656 RepID=A0A975BDL3_9BACT|nr:Uncharacterized protein dnl_59010 [Desulfonema limicola]
MKSEPGFAGLKDEQDTGEYPGNPLIQAIPIQSDFERIRRISYGNQNNIRRADSKRHTGAFRIQPEKDGKNNPFLKKRNY